MIRPAQLSDLPALMALEDAAFTGDKLSRRSMRRMITNEQALFLVELAPSSRDLIAGSQAASRDPAIKSRDDEPTLRAALLLFQHRRSKLARIYSLAVDPAFRRQGIAEALLREAESRCTKPGIKLELRADNAPARALYERLGYFIRREIRDFYEDACTAIEMVKDRDEPRGARDE